MVNIYEILQRAASLKEETALNSISPERAGGIMYDTLLALNDLWLQQGSALVISKIYASVAAMEADTAPVSDLTGKPLRPGQIVVIASSDSDNGSVYRYNGTDAPSWSLVGSIGNLTPVDSLDSDSTTLPLAAHQGKVLDGKISQLGQQVLNNFIIGADTTLAQTTIVGLLPNCPYRISLPNPNFDRSGDTLSYTHLIFSVSAISNAVETFIFQINGNASTLLNDYYDFVTPAQFDRIQVSCRATMGVRVEFSLGSLNIFDKFKKLVFWQQGTNGTTPGTIVQSGIRCIALFNDVAHCKICYNVNPNYSIIVNEWNDEDAEFYHPLSWFNGIGIYNIEKKNISVVIKKNDGSAITPADIADNVTDIVISNEYDTALDALIQSISNSDEIVNHDNFVQGTIQTSGENIGQIVSSSIRCVAVLDLPNGTGISVVIAPGYKVGLSCYSDGDEQTTSTGFKEGNTIFKTFGEHSYLIVGKVDNSNIIPSEVIANVVSCSTIDGNPILLNLKSIEDDVYDRDRNGLDYVGEALPFGRKMLIKDYMTIPNWSNSQGGAIYGDYLVTCMAIDEIADNITNGHIYNIKTGALVSDLIFGYTMDGVDYQKPHANEVCFGKKFYNNDSQFPLLYVSQVRDSGASAGVKGGVMVYDLQYDSANSKYVPVLVQVIMPDTNDAELMDVWGKYTPNYIVDVDNDALYVLNYPKATWFDLAGNTFLCKFDLPDPTDTKVVVLTSADLKVHYEIPNCYGLQMTFYYGGKLYISGGFGGINNLKVVRVWDLVSKCETTKIDLSRILSEEPQFIGLYGNRFLWYSAGTSGLISEFIF